MPERDERILNHIGRYRMTLRPVLDHVFFERESSGCGNVINNLIRKGLVRSRSGLPNRRNYYQLTRAGAEGRVPLDRTRDQRGQTLRTNLGVLWYCCMLNRPRRRLEKHELAKVFEPPPTGPHCIERGEVNRIYRCRVVGTKTRVDALMKAIRIRIDAANDHPKLKNWIESENYAFVLLVEQLRVQQLEQALHQSRLRELARIVVARVPSPQDLSTVTASWQKRS